MSGGVPDEPYNLEHPVDCPTCGKVRVALDHVDGPTIEWKERSVSETDLNITIRAKNNMPVLVTRERLAYGLSTHLCYTAVQPDDKAIDVLIERMLSFTPELEARRQRDLQLDRDEYMADQLDAR